MNKNQNLNHKPLNENTTIENSDSEYTFVEERIVTKRHRMRRVLTKFIVNLLMPVCACALVCYLYFTFFVDEDNEIPIMPEETTTENSIIVNGNDEDLEKPPTGEDETPDNLELEENLKKLEETIQKMTVTIAVVHTDVNGIPPTMEEADIADYHTGVIVSMNGPVYILIPQENINGYRELYAMIDDEITLPTTVYDIDDATGLALLKIEDAKMTGAARKQMMVATFEGLNQVNEGSTIVYSGNTLGNTSMFIIGHISDTKKHVTCIDLNYNVLVTDILLDDVDDGFLFNSKGNLVGIVGLSDGGLETTNVIAGARALDLEYIINNMLNDKSDIYFGITGQEVSAEIEAIAGGKMPRGIYVNSVLIDSPAYNAGIMPGDIIFTIDGLDALDMNKFRNYIERKEKGDTIQVKVKRKIGDAYNIYSMPLILNSRD